MAFRSGLASVVDIDWLRMFDHNELQFLISGANVPIDLEDLKRNTNYTGDCDDDYGGCNASSLSSPRRLTNKQELTELNDYKRI